MSSIAWLTCAEYPAGIDNEQDLITALRAAGHRVDPLVWDAPARPLAHFDALILRSTWDYHLKYAAWSAWIEEVESQGLRVFNPVSTLRWNSDKRYLLDLQARGANIVPTLHLSRGASASLTELLASQRWERVVVKPAVSASAHETWIAAAGGDNQGRFAAALEQGDLLLQPFMPEVNSEGEWSLIYLGRRFSHAVIKRPAQGDFRTQDEYGARIEAIEPPDFLLAQAGAILDKVEGPLLYARVDGLLRRDQFYLMELELIEPSLFLEHHPQAAGRFQAAIEAMLASQSSNLR